MSAAAAFGAKAPGASDNRKGGKPAGKPPAGGAKPKKSTASSLLELVIIVGIAVLLAFGLPFFFVAIETISTSIILTVILFWCATRAFPENAWMKKMTLVAAQGPEYVTSRDFTAFRGAVGTASSFLRPAGVATMDGRRVDVLTSGEFIAAGTPVRVTRVEGTRIFVEPL